MKKNNYYHSFMFLIYAPMKPLRGPINRPDPKPYPPPILKLKN